jgi:hypothetical protein
MIAKPNTSIRAGGETYSPNEVKAILERLAQLGINRDKIIAQITPEEAMILKRLGGSGKINPKTGLLSFDDDGGGDDGGGGGEGDGGGGGYGDDGGYGGGWEGGSGGTYGGGYGGFDAGAFADAVAANNEAMSGAIGDAMGYGTSGEGSGIDFGGEKSDARAPGGELSSFGANIGALQDAYEQSLAEQVAANNAFMSGAIGSIAGEMYGPGNPETIAMAQDYATLAGQGKAGSALDEDAIAAPAPAFGPYGDINTNLNAAATPFDWASKDDLRAALENRGEALSGLPAFGPSIGTTNWDAWSQGYNANQLDPAFGDPNAYAFGQQPDIIQGVLDAAPAAPSWMTPPADIPNVSTTPAWTAPPTEVATLPVAEAAPFDDPFSSGASGYDSSDRSGGGSDEGGERWVNPTGIVPTSETPVLIDNGGLEPPPIPAAPTAPTVAAAPVLPTQLIDWYRYGELYPEFGYYQSNRVPTPYKAHGGYFDADAYFADGGLVSQPQQPVQPVTASAPTMAYTDGQGVVGAAAAPPALSPFDAYGLDVQRASPMAPAPAAAAPSFGGLEALATRNRNAAPVQSQISQNPNLGYSLGVSPLSQIRG